MSKKQIIMHQLAPHQQKNKSSSTYIRKGLAIVITNLLAILCFSQSIEHTLVKDLLVTPYNLFYSTDAIDSKLIRYLKKADGFELLLTNPGIEFNKTDVIIKGLPNKRLIFVGKSAERSNFILYETGGNAPYLTCLIYRKNGKKKFNVSAIRLQDEIKSMNDLKRLIEEGKYLILK